MLDKAIEAYKKAIAIKPNYADAHYNMAVSLKEQDQLNEALEAYHQTIAVSPSYFEAFYNLGNIHLSQNRLMDALDTYNKALAINPNYAEALLNKGNTLERLGRYDQAILAFNSALEFKPDYAEAYNNLGNILIEQGKPYEALATLNKAIQIRPDYADACISFGNSLIGLSFDAPSTSLIDTISKVLDHGTYVRPKEIASATLSLIGHDAVVKNLRNKGQAIDFSNLDTMALQLCRVPLLLKLMSVSPITDIQLEHIFVSFRRCSLLEVCESIGDRAFSAEPKRLQLQSAIALQCFINEYIYDISEEEEIALSKINKSLKAIFWEGLQPNPLITLCLASYKALIDYNWCEKLKINEQIENVFVQQVLEPQRESSLKKGIPKLENITDGVSNKVMEQYEENPYPKWVQLGLPPRPLPVSRVVQDLKLILSDQRIVSEPNPQILVAGCGTGQHSISTGARFKDSDILAVDLSVTSLSYAKRKTQEMGLKNIEYMQADILDIDKLDKKFDIIECVGVLHHMRDPLAGWKMLKNCLKPGGLMKVGLYSRLARTDIKYLREKYNTSQIPRTVNSIRSFRSKLINLNNDTAQSILSSGDMYSVSEMRDLLFHVQEHNLSIPIIRDWLKELQLHFCGFEHKLLINKFQQVHPEPNCLYDLVKWHAYELDHTESFTQMYQFWCQSAF
ncbi:MAG: hypothetical protein CMO97_01715 [Woeseia sp.]|nr:hypothetical protein [Woeseia sp.]